MRFLVDQQLPPSLAEWLAAQGHEADHVSALGLGAAADSVIWREAERRSAVIVTKDADFAARRSVTTQSTPAVVWIRLGNCRTADLISAIAKTMPALVAALERGDRLVEIV